MNCSANSFAAFPDLGSAKLQTCPNREMGLAGVRDTQGGEHGGLKVSHGGPVRGVDVSLNGRWLATASYVQELPRRM